MTNRLPPLFAALSLGVFGCLAAAPAARADDPPHFDIEATCKSTARSEVALSDVSPVKSCLTSERGAEADLKKRWNQFPGSAKSQCTKQFQAGGFPSYVELITCLELASGSVPSQEGSALSDVGGQGASGGGKKPTGSTIQEPPADQRTNPSEVLRGK